MRRRFSYANVAATLALVFAMSGGAFAAKHYLVSSTKQISPKVLKKLKGKAGPKGANGVTGATGPTGPTGATGAPGAAGKDGVGTPLFFKAPANTGGTVIANLDGAQIVAECTSGNEAILTLHITEAHGMYHGSYDISGTGTEVYEDDLQIGKDLKMQGTGEDYEGWFSYIGPHGVITTAVFGDDSTGSPSGKCLVWGNLNTSSTGSTGGV
jgi:hypothetical protein